VLFPVGVVYKGSGFYTTDYARKNGSSSSAGENGKGESTEAKAGEKKDVPAKKEAETPASAKD
jgi:predicted nucleic acid-binding Zn ribbon protein